MPLIITNAPGVILEYKGKKKNGHPSTEKFLELELSLSEIEQIDALESVFPGLEQRLQLIAASEGSSEKMELCSAIGDMSLLVVASDKKTEVLRIEQAKWKNKLKLHVGPKAESVKARVKFVGALAPTGLPRVDDYTGADVFVTLKALQTDPEKDKPKTGGSKNKSTRKTQVDIEDVGDKAA